MSAADDLREALRRYNVGPDWTRAEVLNLVQRLTKSLSEAVPVTLGATTASKILCPRCKQFTYFERADKHEAEMLKVIDERDRLEALLDQFAYAVADEATIGEHSSANDPWANALAILRGEA